MEALGISDFEFLEGLLQQLIELCSPGTSYVDVKKANFVLSIIKSIAPRDPIEVMLAFQMAEIQMALTTATHASTFQIRFHDMQLARAMLSKLARVYTLQMEALRRHRNGGEHKITVQYINVSNGGQAIVGDVTHAPRGQRNKSEDTPKALAEASMAPMAATAGLSKHRRSACHTRPTRKNSA